MSNKFKIGDEVLVIRDGGDSSGRYMFERCIGRTGIIISWDDVDLKVSGNSYKVSIRKRFPYMVKFNFELKDSTNCFKDKNVRHFSDDEIILSSSKEAERIYLQKYRDVEEK